MSATNEQTGQTMSNANRHDDHVDPLIGGLKTTPAQGRGLALKWRIVIAALVLVALVVIISHQAF